MDDRRKVIFFILLAGAFSSLSVIATANPHIVHLFIVLPLALQGISLFFAGYFAGKRAR